eukprot:scaffold296_cov164-Ochromonas_danica.AAC.7
MTLCRLGPKTGQGSMESYKLDVGNGEIRLKVEVSTADGTRFNLIKYLTRFDDSGAIPLGNNEPVFTLGKYTMGWSFFDFWPSTMLSNATISIVKAIKVHSQDSKSNAKILETAWTLASFQGEAPIDFYAITRSMGGVLNDGEDVYMFVIKVIVGDSSWFVAHRYREFDALRKYLLAQSPFVTSFQENDARFPRKTLFHSPTVLESRAKALDEFISVYLKDARICRQNSIDAICSFLQLPEHLYEVALAKRLVPPPEPTVTTISAPASSHNASAQPSPARSQNVSQPASAHTSSSSLHILGRPAAPLPAAPSEAATSIDEGDPNIGMGRVSVASFFPGVEERAGTRESISDVNKPAVRKALQVSAPKARLMSAMGEEGMQIIKHGRQGAPKRRSLFISPDGVHLIIQAEDHYKVVKFASITSIRLGTDIDPATPASVLKKIEGEDPEELNKRRSTRRGTLSGVLRGNKDVLFGTATLRRSCDPSKFDKCISFITPNRTVDIECLNVEDLRVLHDTMTEICRHNNTISNKEEIASVRNDDGR